MTGLQLPPAITGLPASAQRALAAGAFVVTAVAIALVLAPLGVLVIGLITGLIYALLALGLVLIFKANRFVNFAHGQVGAFSSLLLAKAVLDWGWNYWIALVGAVGLAVAIGGLVAVGLVRPLHRRPRLVLMVATIGVAQLLLAVTLLWDGLGPDPLALVTQGYPTPLSWRIEIGHQVLGGAELMILLVVPALAAAGAAFFRWSPLGLAIRAVSANSDAARLAGVSIGRTSLLTWLIAGGLSGLTAVLLAPSAGTYSQEVLGPGLLVRALAAAVAGRMTSMPVAAAAGLGLGVLEQVVFWRTPQGGVTDLVIFLVLLVALVIRFRNLGAGSTGEETVRFPTRPRPLPSPDAAWVPRAGVAAGLVLVLAAPLWMSQAAAFELTIVVVYAIVGMALTALVGWSGQLSLGHFAFVGIGAYTAARLAGELSSVVLALVAAAVVGALVAAAIGLTSVWGRGLMLPVATLAAGVAAKEWAFNLDGITGPVQLAAPTILGNEITTQKGLYYVAVVVAVLVAIALRQLRASGPGRLLVAARDNDAHLAAHGTRPAGVRVAAFAVSGAMASAAGVLWAYAFRNFDANAFAPQVSIALIAMLVIGGAGSLVGAVLAAIAVFGIPTLLDLSFGYSVLISGIGVILTVLFRPDGIISSVWDLRDGIVRFAAAASRTASLPVPDPNEPALRCEQVTVRFGGLRAVDDVTLEVPRGTVVGLIGANGAGKTTLMNAISGHVPVDAGRISVGNVDVTGLPPEYRPYVGVARSFQDAALYEGLTVRETVLVALERRHRGGLLSAMVGAPWHRWSERRKEEQAAAILSELGLTEHGATEVGALSTGLRRAVDLAATLAQGAEVLLLDEPTAGLAQREVEAFVPLLQRVRERLRCTILLIEHDMGLIMALSDRVVAMEAGRVIASGSPDAIRSDPAVIASYLGSRASTIERSGRTSAKRTRARKSTRAETTPRTR